VSTTIKPRVKRADRSLDRAADYVDDGKGSSAAASLKSVNSNLTAAAKAAKRALSGDNGPANSGAVLAADDNAISELIGLFDGADDDTTAAVATGLDGVITQRDDLVAAIAALTADQQQDYYGVLDELSDSLADELGAIDDALTDGTNTSAGTDALNAAKAKITATQTTVKGLTDALDAADPQNVSDSDSGGRGDCPGGRQGDRGPRSGNDGGAQST
jgi:hypothetical protein